MDAKKQPTLTLDQLREQRDRLRLEREVHLLSRSKRLLEDYFVGSGHYNDIVDPRERFRGPDGLYWIPVGGYDDRRFGNDLYTVFDEQTLQYVRARARMLLAVNPYAKGIVSNLTNYIIGTGFTFRAAAKKLPNPKEKVPPDLIALVQAELDDFLKINKMVPDPERAIKFAKRQREAFRRTRRDGEALLRTFVNDEGKTLVRFVEPECVRAPDGKDKDPEWSFGVHTDPEDVETVLGYWVRYGQNDPGDEIDTSEIVHIKINTDDTIKRGYSDLECIHDTLELARKVLRNMGEGSAIQAAIAYIREHETASKEQVQAFVDDASEYSYVNSRTGKTENFEYVGPGTIVDVPKGLKYLPTPFAAANIGGHIEVLNALLRMAAASLNIPEFMVSSDASNANFASTLVSESPFVKLAQQEQEVYQEAFLELVWKALRNAVAAGRLPSEIEELIEIQATPPSLVVRDQLAEAQTLQIENASRVTSVQTWQQKIGRDPEQEQANFEEYEERFGLGEPLELPGDLPPEQAA